MTTALFLTIIFAAIMLCVAVVNWLNYRRQLNEVFELKTFLENAERESEFLREKIDHYMAKRGIDDSSVMSLISDISRIENNLYHMQEVPGRRQISKALERMKVTLQAEDYTIVPLLGTAYHEGMQAIVVFVEDESLMPGSSIITSVQKPQVNRGGRMIQAATVTVGQNV